MGYIYITIFIIYIYRYIDMYIYLVHIGKSNQKRYSTHWGDMQMKRDEFLALSKTAKNIEHKTEAVGA